jgi:hypothetical protein
MTIAWHQKCAPVTGDVFHSWIFLIQTDVVRLALDGVMKNSDVNKELQSTGYVLALYSWGFEPYCAVHGSYNHPMSPKDHESSPETAAASV